MKRRTVLTGLAAAGLIQTGHSQAQGEPAPILPDRLYAEDHTWILLIGDLATIGLTAVHTEQLGEIIYLEYTLPPGTAVKPGDEIASLESGKVTWDIFAPVSGEIIEMNTRLSVDGENQPSLINEAPYTDGWLCKIRVDQQDLSQLLSAEAYRKISGDQ